MPSDRNELIERAKNALQKKGAFGEDFDLKTYSEVSGDIPVFNAPSELPSSIKEAMLKTGVNPSAEGNDGSMLVIDNSIVLNNSSDDGFELMDIRDALKKYDWLKEYSWNAVSVDADKYTAATYLNDSPGYFIRAFAGKKVKLPVQTCIMIGHNTAAQTIHNIIIVEEGASIEIISGCTSGSDVDTALHMGISEMYIKKDASLKFTMIHNWAENIGVRPRTGIVVEENGTFINNYVILKKVKSVQTYPTAKLVGRGAVAQFNTVAIAQPGAELDLGSRAILAAPECRAEIISRSITVGGKVINRGTLEGDAKDIKAHLECRGLILGDSGENIAIPELDARVADVEMTHEASLGKVAQDQVEYIMSRGLTEDEAVGMIVRGFLEVGIRGIPDAIKAEIDEAIRQSDLATG